MPDVSFVDTRPVQGKANPVEENLKSFFTKLGKDYTDKQDKVEIGKIIDEYSVNKDKANAVTQYRKAVATGTLSPSKQLQAKEFIDAEEKAIQERDKALNAQIRAMQKNKLDPEEREEMIQNQEKRGMPRYEAESWVDGPPSVKAQIERTHQDQLTRNLRHPLDSQGNKEINAGNPVNDIAQPIVEDLTGATAKPISIEPKKEEWPAPEIPESITPAEKVKWENNNEKENNKELKESQTKKKAFQTNRILINSMTNANESKKLPSGLSKLVIDPKTGDLRGEAQLAGLVNPETELYVKNLKQFLKGAKDFFGARVTNFDVTSFMAQLPGLLNSEQGRRMILKQMEYVNDLEEVHNNTLNEGLKKYGRKANYGQVVKVVDEKVSEREKGLLGKINNVVKASNMINIMSKNPEKFKDSVLMLDPEGKFKAVPKDKVASRIADKWVEY